MRACDGAGPGGIDAGPGGIDGIEGGGDLSHTTVRTVRHRSLKKNLVHLS